ncbi:uncharacterized protein B0H18DRAFT_1000074 [Fomitopsis serialis]|uniref:uncharacterized protein n=1 Tax=Fomitopsis serialis TaxID=139415 RepID=UPI00200832C7|nr:uncharacterized protein B0H18DRAFT_1000074 [Neoantrodia serialis]KAH9928670.1 hypothetical protein B0H18DRAFT_1000074 [Neoantrodia serialis]
MLSLSYWAPFIFPIAAIRYVANAIPYTSRSAPLTSGPTHSRIVRRSWGCCMPPRRGVVTSAVDANLTIDRSCALGGKFYRRCKSCSWSRGPTSHGTQWKQCLWSTSVDDQGERDSTPPVCPRVRCIP